MGYDTDRTFSAQQWRVVVFVACGVLIAGIGFGVGRMTAVPPDPPPASAPILPDMLPPSATDAAAPSASADEETDESPLPQPVVAAPPPAPVVTKTAPSPAPVAIAPKPERSARPRHAEAKARQASAEPKPPASGPRWVVQLGAFQSSDHAHLLVNTLAAHSETAHVTFTQNAAGQGWFYVQTPPYRSAAAAKNAAQSLTAREHLPTYLMKLPDAH